jgi:hypothetical protein
MPVVANTASSSENADASGMPTIPAANSDLPTIMVAERIAAWLAGDRGGNSLWPPCPAARGGQRPHWKEGTSP